LPDGASGGANRGGFRAPGTPRCGRPRYVTSRGLLHAESPSPQVSQHRADAPLVEGAERLWLLAAEPEQLVVMGLPVMLGLSTHIGSYAQIIAIMAGRGSLMPTFSLNEQPEVFFSTTQTSRAVRRHLERGELRQLGRLDRDRAQHEPPPRAVDDRRDRVRARDDEDRERTNRYREQRPGEPPQPIVVDARERRQEGLPGGEVPGSNRSADAKPAADSATINRTTGDARAKTGTVAPPPVRPGSHPLRGINDALIPD
jgi:hypothetical protein